MAKRLNNSGQTLIESVFAVGITGLILSGLVFGIIYFSRASTSARDRSLAVKLVQSRMEDLRAEKTDTPASFWTDAADSSTRTEDPVAGLENPTEYRRETTFSNYDESFSATKRVKVTVMVSWQDGNQRRSIDASSYFSGLK